MAQDATRQLMDHFRRIVKALRTSHRAAGHLNLTGAQLFVINVIGEAGGPLSVNDVAERTETDQSTVSRSSPLASSSAVCSSVRAKTTTAASSCRSLPRGGALQKKGPATLAQQRLAAAV